MINPYLPLAPGDGKHIFNGGYRCTRCGVYDRPDVLSTKEVLDASCKGQWDQSGKMRAWAEDKWREANQPLYALMTEMDAATNTWPDGAQNEARIAILRPFLAQIWDDAYDAGTGDTEIYNGLYELPTLSPPHVPATNPFKDPDA